MKKKRSWLSGIGGMNIFLLGLVSLLNDFSSEMILPILPMLISSFGGTGLTIGLIGGMIMGLPEILKVFVGFWSDKIKKRKLFIFLGYLDSQIFKFLLVFSKGWQSVMAFTTLDKLGKGIREAPRDALISESLPEHKGKEFGLQRAFDTTGAILGSITVLLLVIFFNPSFKNIILISAAIGFCSLIPLYFLREVDGSLKKKKNEKKIGTIYASLSELPRELKLFLIIAGIFALGNFSYMFFVLKSAGIFSGSSGNGNFTIPILLYVLFNIFYAGFAVPFGNLSDRVGRKKVIGIGFLLFSIVCLGFIASSNLALMIPLFIAYGLVYALLVGTQRAFVSDLSDSRLRATSIGAFQTTLGVCAIIAGLIAGVLYDLNPAWTFAYGFVMSFIAFCLLWIFIPNKRIKKLG